MQKVINIEKVEQALPPAGQTRFHTLSYERGVRDALQFVLDKGKPSREIEFYAKLAGITEEAEEE